MFSPGQRELHSPVFRRNPVHRESGLDNMLVDQAVPIRAHAHGKYEGFTGLQRSCAYPPTCVLARRNAAGPLNVATSDRACGRHHSR